MPHSKLPWKGDTSAIALDEICFIVDDNDQLIAEVSGDTKNDAASKRNLIITAVNVMPEVGDFLADLLNQDLSDSMTDRTVDLLEKLEGIE